MLYGTTQHNAPSRFLSEIDASYVEEISTGVSFAGYAGGGGYDSGMGYAAGRRYDDSNYQAPAPPKTDDGPRYVPDFEIGDGVRHQLFGDGTIVELDGENATIFFRGKGPKRLNISFAPLEKL
jgi:DNA helicase-2/ATP-dependent DNA helicase PcrA